MFPKLICKDIHNYNTIKATVKLLYYPYYTFLNIVIFCELSNNIQSKLSPLIPTISKNYFINLLFPFHNQKFYFHLSLYTIFTTNYFKNLKINGYYRKISSCTFKLRCLC